MRRLFMNFRNEQGFILPYTIVICCMVIIAIVSLASIYENELRMTKRLSEQLYVESIVQMIPYDLKEDLHSNNEWNAEYLPTYYYEYGTATINKMEQVEEVIHVHLIIQTETLSYSYTLVIPSVESNIEGK